jgi:hypothetical protein
MVKIAPIQMAGVEIVVGFVKARRQKGSHQAPHEQAQPQD